VRSETIERTNLLFIYTLHQLTSALILNTMMKLANFARQLPSIVWVFLLPLGVITFIGSIIFIFTTLATVEGVASLIFLALGLAYVRGAIKQPQSNKSTRGDAFATAISISFFALMGMAIDQPGNFIYNKPIEVVACPANTSLTREVIVSNPLPGRTDMTQDFTCVDAANKPIERVSMFTVIAVRFVEYVFLGYLLLGVAKLGRQLKTSNHVAPDGDTNNTSPFGSIS
jgi:hypothetical protein